MNKKWLILIAPFAIVLFTWLGGEVVMHLWNWLVPALFGLHGITFWQGVGLLVLCRILFGGWGGGGSNHGPGRKKGRRWTCMTDEEQEQFREWSRSGPATIATHGTHGSEPA